MGDFAKVGTQSTFKGTEKLGELVSGPNMAVIDATPTACGRANVACATAPATWNGGPAGMHSHHMHCCWDPKHYWGHSCGLSGCSPAVLFRFLSRREVFELPWVAGHGLPSGSILLAS